MNKKIFFIIIIIIIIAVIIFLCYKYFFQNSNNKIENIPQVNTDKLATEITIENQTEADTKKQLEEELSSFTTPLKSKASGRLTNIQITCSKLNETIVGKGETFSFCNTTGPSTAEQGYKEADIIVDGKTKKALGGGNCQISSTLYNAVLAVPNLVVIERHEHGKDVHYVPEGKDAAVSYGSVDFKFKNNTENELKMYFSSDDENVTVRIVKLT